MQRILYLEDNSVDADLVGREIKKHWPNVELKTVNHIAKAKQLILSKTYFDCALFDLKLPDGNGMDLLSELRAEKCDLPIIILTGTGSEEIATTALKAGANDYIPKKAGYHKIVPEQIEFTVNQAPTNRQDLSVLYVEHHKSDADLTYRHFKKHAPYIHLTRVSSGEAALELLPKEKDHSCKYDVLLLDYRLPGLNALGLSKIIRLERKISIAIVIVTGQGDENTAVEALKIGVDDYIIKHDNYLLRLPSVLTSAYRHKELERQHKILNQSETKYRLLADYAADWEYWINPKGEYIYNSPVCEKISGYPPEAFEKNKDLLAEITFPEYQEMVKKHFSQGIKEIHKPIEFKILTKEGKEKWISHFCQAVYDNDNNYAGMRGVNRDITERKRAEQIQQVILNISNATQKADDLAETMQIIQKELGLLMDTQNFYVALYDDETDQIHLPYYQDEKDNIVDFPAGKTLTGLVIKRGKSILIDNKKALELEEEEKIERIGFDAAIWLGVPLKIKGKVTGAFVVQSYTDPNAYDEKDKEILEIVSHQISISIERKQEEEKLMAALEAAKESDRIKTAFLANMSHELRTPLNAIIGFSDLIDEDTKPMESVDFAKLINRSGKNLLAIVDEIFEMTLVEQDQIDLTMSKMPVQLFIDDIYQTILIRQKNLGIKSIIIDKEIRGIDLNTECKADFNKLKQVFLNLLGNALKFTHEGFIRFGVFLSEDANDLVFFVEDSGIGIPKELHQSIFDRFKIADESLTRQYGGIGAGLFISKKLVTLMGGEIWVESEEGKGSTFYFKIPHKK